MIIHVDREPIIGPPFNLEDLDVIADALREYAGRHSGSDAADILEVLTRVNRLRAK